MMSAVGIICCIVGLIHGVHKYFVIRRAARHVYNSGGVKVMDFVFVVPIWFAVGAALLLKHTDLYPFSFFGLVLYFLVGVVLYSVMELEYKLGKPAVEKRLAEMSSRGSVGGSRADDAHGSGTEK